MNSYYPWKTWKLRAWLDSEIKKNSGTCLVLSEKLKVSPNQIWQWLAMTSETITLNQLQAISAYRGTSLEAVVEWLGIRPAHLAELIGQAETPTIRQAMA